MVQGQKKSRTFARKQYTSPGGVRRVRYTKKNNDSSICGMCGVKLLGVPVNSDKLSKSQKRPERPYGGVLCSPCSREFLKKKIIAEANA